MEIFKITKGIASDASHIYALGWKSAYKNIVPQVYLDNLSLERWTPLLQASTFSSFIMKDKGEFVATSSIATARDEKMKGWGEIISIYVLPEHFRKGYGQQLLVFAINKLHSNGFNKIYLWVLDENKRARKFYEQNGFSANGDKKTMNIGGKELIEVCYVYTINQ